MEFKPVTDQPRSVLGVEVGSVHTKAVLFESVEGAYRFIAEGVVPSTHNDPVLDVSRGVSEALTHIESVTGRKLLDLAGHLIIPAKDNREGVDQFVVCTSCSPRIDLAVFGLYGDLSLDSVTRLAHSTYSRVVETIGINDRRPANVQLDAVLAACPDVIIFAGGSDGGAKRSLQKVSQLITNILEVIPRSARPQVLYCGNSAIGQQISESLDKFTSIRVCNNIRPAPDIENLGPAQEMLSSMVFEYYYGTIKGLQPLVIQSSVPPLLSNLGFQRVVKFLGTQYDPGKGVLGIDIGASSVVACYSNDCATTLNTFAYGLGEGIAEVLASSTISDISRWLGDSLPEDKVRDYLWQRTLFPESISVSTADLAIELAVSRQILRLVMRELYARKALPSRRFEPILLSGAVLSRAVTPQQCLQVILDGIQPLGISPLILDKHGILPLLGTAAGINPLLGVQVLESDAFTNLATVVSAVSRARSGRVLMVARLTYSDGTYVETEVRKGGLYPLSLGAGEWGLLTLRKIQHASIEEVDLPNEPIKVPGGVCGVVIDARGRPLHLPDDQAKRSELLRSWSEMLGEK